MTYVGQDMLCLPSEILLSKLLHCISEIFFYYLVASPAVQSTTSPEVLDHSLDFANLSY
jgi:hypothetical protein